MSTPVTAFPGVRGFSQKLMTSLKLRAAKIRHPPLCINNTHLKYKSNESQEQHVSLFQSLQMLSQSLKPFIFTRFYDVVHIFKIKYILQVSDVVYNMQSAIFRSLMSTNALALMSTNATLFRMN